MNQFPSYPSFDRVTPSPPSLELQNVETRSIGDHITNVITENTHAPQSSQPSDLISRAHQNIVEDDEQPSTSGLYPNHRIVHAMRSHISTYDDSDDSDDELLADYIPNYRQNYEDNYSSDDELLSVVGEGSPRCYDELTYEDETRTSPNLNHLTEYQRRILLRFTKNFALGQLPLFLI